MFDIISKKNKKKKQVKLSSEETASIVKCKFYCLSFSQLLKATLEMRNEVYKKKHRYIMVLFVFLV
jgi:hypothetical protein